MQLSDSSLFQQSAYINGEWVTSDKTIVVDNPATGETLGSVPSFGSKETAAAIDVAENAFKEWRKKTAKERSVILRKWYELLLENQEDLAQIMTAEQGKPLTESRGEVVYAANFIEWFAEEGRRTYGETIPTVANDRRLITVRQPIGVCAAITPWNFPAAMITRKAAPALAAGCTMVVKPASQTPFSALALAVLAERAGIPKGVFSVITGSAREIGEEMTTNPKVRKVTFTGSTEVGRVLMQQSAADIKKVSMELGGNAPFIVFDDADIDAAVAGAIACKFRNAGQTCVCANRIYVQDGIYDSFAKKLEEAVSKMEVGPGIEDKAQGPLIDEDAVSKVKEHIEDAVQRGASILIGGDENKLKGRFFNPTVLANVPSDAQICREETFGPVAPIIRFKSEDEVLEYANDTPFGLASYFYANDLGRVWRVAESLETGMVGVNTGILSTVEAPFGGVKQSGVGREGSKYGIEEFLEIKFIMMAGI